MEGGQGAGSDSGPLGDSGGCCIDIKDSVGIDPRGIDLLL